MPAASLETGSGNRRIHNLRWWIAGMLGAATALNYLDRQSLPVVISEIQKSIPVTNQQYSQLQVMFLLAYAVMYAAGGEIIDRVGTRRGYTIMIVWWSAACALHGLVSTVLGLGMARFLLGLGEGGGFPGSAKAVAEWFPAKERSLAFGIFNTGSSAGAVIAPPLIAAISLSLGWRWVFIITGALGFVWAAAWLWLYQKPEESRRITVAERDYLRSAKATVNSVAESPRPRWVHLFYSRQVWGLITAKFFSDAAWFFFIFWLPKYLGDVRHLDIKQIGYFAWIPYACAGAGSIAGGWLGSYLLRRGMSLNGARKLSLVISAALMPASLLISASPLAWAIAFFSMAMFGHQFWSTTVQTMVADMFPASIVGSVAGLIGAAGSFGGMVFNLLVGMLLTWYGGYGIVLFIAGLLHPLSLLLILVLVRRVESTHFSPRIVLKPVGL